MKLVAHLVNHLCFENGADQAFVNNFTLGIISFLVELDVVDKQDLLFGASKRKKVYFDT